MITCRLGRQYLTHRVTCTRTLLLKCREASDKDAPKIQIKPVADSRLTRDTEMGKAAATMIVPRRLCTALRSSTMQRVV